MTQNLEKFQKPGKKLKRKKNDKNDAKKVLENSTKKCRKTKKKILATKWKKCQKIQIEMSYNIKNYLKKRIKKYRKIKSWKENGKNVKNQKKI